MINSGVFAGKTIFITGGSRGIGKAIALKLGRDGANIVIGAKTVDPHPKLEGTIFTAAKEIESIGGKCLPLQVDIRDDNSVSKAIDETVKQFGGIDVLINNASAIQLTGTERTDMKKYDLMNDVNTRGTFMTSKFAIPHLKKSGNGHILTLSPPLEMKEMWFKNHVAYSIAKYGMSMCVLGMAGEYAGKVAVNGLWPKTAIYTAAMKMIGGGEKIADSCRKVDIMADAAYWILSQDKKKFTGNFCIDEEIVLNAGVTDLEQYSIKPGADHMLDFFLPEKYLKNKDNPSTDEGQQVSTDQPLIVDKIFQLIKTNMTDEIKKELNALVCFCINGKNFYLDAKSSGPFEISTEEIGKPDVTLNTDEKTFIEMAKGKTKSTNAFMAGKLKIKGNLAVAMKAEKLFGQLKSKL